MKEKRINNFKGLMLNGNNYTIPMEYCTSFTGISKISHIESVSYELSHDRLNIEGVENVWNGFLDDDPKTGFINIEKEYINTYKYNPQEYYLISTKGIINLYTLVNNAHEKVFTKFGITIKKAMFYKGRIYFLSDDNTFYVIFKSYNFDKKVQEIKCVKYYDLSENSFIDISINKEKTITTAYKNITIVPQSDRNKANEYSFPRFNIINQNNEIVEQLLFIYVHGYSGSRTYYAPVIYTDNKISNRLKDPLTALTYSQTAKIKLVISRNGEKYEMENFPIAGDIFPTENNYKLLVNYLTSFHEIEITKPNPVDIDTSETTTLKFIETALYDDSSEIIINKTEISYTEGDKISLELDTSNIQFNDLEVSKRVYCKLSKNNNYELFAEFERFDDDKKKYYSSKDFKGIYLEQTIGINDLEGVNLITDFTDFNFINDVMYAVKAKELYYPIIGNGAITKLFYDINIIPEVQGNLILNVSGDIGLADDNKINIVSVQITDGVLLFGKKGEIGFIVKDENDYYETSNGLIINSQKGIYLYNGNEVQILSKEIADLVINNYKKFNVFYSIKDNLLFVYNNTDLYIYDFFYQYYRNYSFNRKIDKIIQNIQGDLFILSKGNIYEFKEEYGFSKYTSGYFNFGNLIRIFSIFIHCESNTLIKYAGKDYLAKDNLVKIYIPLDKQKLEEYAKIDFEYVGKIHEIIINYDEEAIQ